MLDTGVAPWPSYTKEEADAIAEVLLSNRVNYWTGKECREFEIEFANWSGCSKAIAVGNGTLALDLALKALGVGVGDEVVVTPRSFIASASCVANAGAKPVFADVDRDSQNITAETILPVLSDRTKAILCVHLAGWPCEMDPIMALANERGISVIEDCAQAHGARYKGRSVGAFGDINAWSFCQDKIITTGGEGGMVTTDNLELWDKAWSYKDHGKSWDAVYNRSHPPGFRWVHDTLGTNWRMTEVQGVLGRIQLRRMEEWHQARVRNSEVLLRTARQIPILRVPDTPSHVEHAWYRCYVFVRPELLRSGWSRDKIVEEINRRGVPCMQGVCSEIYLEEAFKNTESVPKSRLPVTRELGDTSFAFLVHPTLARNEMERMAEVLREVSTEAIA